MYIYVIDVYLFFFLLKSVDLRPINLLANQPYGAQPGRLFTWLEILPLALLAVRTACCTWSPATREQGTGNQQIKTPMFLRSSLQNDIIDLLERCHHKKSCQKKGILKNSCPPRGHETNSKSSIDFLKLFLLAHPMTNQSMSANRLWSDTFDVAKTQEWLS